MKKYQMISGLRKRYDYMNSSQRYQRGLQQSNVCGDTATGVCVRHGLMNSNFLHIAAYTPVLDLEFRFGVSTPVTRAILRKNTIF